MGNSQTSAASDDASYPSNPPPPYSTTSEIKPVPTPLMAGTKMQLRSNTSGKTLRLTGDLQVDAQGFAGPFAQFVLVPSADGYARFQNVQNPARYISVSNGTLGSGDGGKSCEFFVVERSPGVISLKAVWEKGAIGVRSEKKK